MVRLTQDFFIAESVSTGIVLRRVCVCICYVLSRRALGLYVLLAQIWACARVLAIGEISMRGLSRTREKWDLVSLCNAIYI